MGVKKNGKKYKRNIFGQDMELKKKYQEND